MKKIKMISFILIVSFTCFWCRNKAFAFSCYYEVYTPFETTSNEVKESAYILNFKYAYKKILNHSNDEYINLISSLKNKYLANDKYIKNISVKHYQDQNNTNKEKIDIKVSDDALIVLIGSSGGTFNVDSGALSKNSFTTQSCFDVFAIGNINNIQFSPNIDIDYSNRGFDDVDDVRIKEPMYNAISEVMKKNFYNDYTPILLINSSNDQALSMATIFINVGYYGINFDQNYNVDSIVDKYLSIEGVKKILDVINETDDNDSAKDTTFDAIKNEAVKVVDKVDFDSISDDLSELSNFNNNFSTFNNENKSDFGIRQTLKQYLHSIGAGMSVTQWFNEYARDSKAQYVEALIELLNMLNTDEIKNKKDQLNEVNKVYQDFNHCMQYKLTIENCKSECQKFYAWNACKDSGSNISTCLNAYPNNVCENKEGSNVSNDINNSKKKIEEDVKDIVEKKLVELFENRGIEIGDDQNQLCNILLGKDNENGLYPYIRGVINITRIGVSVLVVVLTGFDVMKVISSFKDDENKKFWNHIKVRLVCLIILILVPTIINVLVKSAISKCVADI